MEDLPEAMLAEIVKRVTKTSDLNSISLVSKKLYSVEGFRGVLSTLAVAFALRQKL
jgi:hypothetical protein